MELPDFNDDVYRRCPVCHEDLLHIEGTSHNWLLTLLGADSVSVSRCPDHDYTRIDKRNRREVVKWELWGGEHARASVSRAYR